MKSEKLIIELMEEVKRLMLKVKDLEIKAQVVELNSKK